MQTNYKDLPSYLQENQVISGCYKQSSSVTSSFTPHQSPKIATKPFEDWLGEYSALPSLMPTLALIALGDDPSISLSVPYFTRKIGNDRLAFVDGLKAGKYYGHDAAIVPLRQPDGTISALQYFSDRPLNKLGATKIIRVWREGGKKGTSNRFGVEIEASSRQFIGEGLATVISASSLIKTDLETDCVISAVDAGNLKFFVQQHLDLLSNPFFYADNDVINPTNKNSRNTGLLTAIECCFMLGLQHEQRIYVPISNSGGKVDFNDLEQETAPHYELLSAIEILQRFQLLSTDTKGKNTFHLNRQCYVDKKESTIKQLIESYQQNPDKNATKIVEVNHKDKTLSYQLMSNGGDLFLCGINRFEIKVLPIKDYMLKKARRKIQPTGFDFQLKGLSESTNNLLQSQAIQEINQVVVELTTLDTHGVSILPLEKNVLDRGKYIPKSYTKMIYSYATSYLISGMGTGKTVAMKNVKQLYSDEARILAISPLISLVENLSKVLTLTKYSDKGMRSKQLITTLHSFNKFFSDFEHCDLLLLDEINHILGLFNSETLKGNVSQLFERFKSVIKNAKKVIIADAYLTQQSFDFINNLRGTNNAIVIKVLDEQSHTKSFRLFEKESSFNNEILATLENNKRVLVPVSSKKYSKELFELIGTQFPDKKKLLINSDTTGELEVKSFLANPNQWMSHYEAIIYTPSISGGVSFDDLKTTPDFELFGCFTSLIHTALDVMQMLGRFRRKTDLNLCISNNLDNSALHSIDEHLVSRKDELVRVIDLLSKNKMLTERFNEDYLKNILQQVVGESANDLDYFTGDFIENQAKHKENFRPVLFDLLKKAQYSFSGFVDGENNDMVTLSKEACERVISKETTQIIESVAIEESEYQALSLKNNRTVAETSQLQRYKIEKRLKLPINELSVRYCLTKKKSVSSAYQLSIAFTPKGKLLEKYIRQLDAESDNFKSITHRRYYLFEQEFLTRLFEACAIKLTATGLELPNNPIRIESLSAFYLWIKPRKNMVSVCGFGKVPSNYFRSLKWVTWVLSRFGIRFDKKTARLRLADPLIGKMAVNLGLEIVI